MVTDNPYDGKDRLEELEQRMNALEERNQQLEAGVEKQQDHSSDVTRRGALGILGGSAMLGLAGTAGAQPGNGNHGHGHDHHGPPFADKDHDHSGDYLGESEPVARIDVDLIGTSRREGDTVYYHPDSPGSYTDGQDAIADVPTGGTLQLGYGVWDVATEGPISVDRSMFIRGVGWTADNGLPTTGTIIKNTGSNAIDSTPLELNADVQYFKTNGGFSDLAVHHDGPTTPAVQVRNFIRTTIDNCYINGESIGLKYEGDTYFSRALRSYIRGTDRGVASHGGGYAYTFNDCHVVAGKGYDPNTSSFDKPVALETHSDRTKIVGGEYTAEGPGGTNIRFYNPSSGKYGFGGYVLSPGMERGELGIEIDGVNQWFNVQIFQTFISLYQGTGVKFGNARDCKWVYPLALSGELVHWTEDATNCGVISDIYNVKGNTYTDDGADNPYIHIVGTADDDQLAELPTGVPTTVDYGLDQQSPVFHDGTSWYEQSSANNTFTP